MSDFDNNGYGQNKDNEKTPADRSIGTGDYNSLFKKDLLKTFHKYGYIEEAKNYEVRIKITSGNVAWITINSNEVIK